jgi:phage anti-repressor protein
MELIQNALVKFEHKEIEPKDLAILAGFSMDELDKIDRYWDPIFNDAWVYLSPEMITEDIGYVSTKVFYRDVLRKKYKENVEYQLVSKNHDIVKSFYRILIPDRKKPGNKASYYIITGKTLKKMLMNSETKKGRETRDYFIKVEELALYMKDYQMMCVLYHEELKILNDVKCDDIIKTALVKYKYKEPTITQLAEHVGFNDDELKILNIFWEPVFNKSWIYLSPSMITKDMGYSKLSNFYTQVMRSNYTENIDYKEVTENDPIIQTYEQFEKNSKCLLISTYKTTHKRGSKPKYYLVTGRALKKMLMKAKTTRGDDICEYYLKVEELAILMKDYIHTLHQFLFQKERSVYKKQLENQKKQIAIQDNRSFLLKSFSEHLQERKFDSYFYIVCSNEYARKNYFKLGITTNLKNRLRQYNCERPEDDMMFYAFIHNCYDSVSIEKRTKIILKDFQKKNSKKIQKDETYFMNFKKLKKIVMLVCNNYNSEIDELNLIIQTFNESFMDIPEIPVSIDIPNEEKKEIISITHEVENGDTKSNTRTVIDVSGLSVEQMKEKLIIAINKFIRENIDDMKDFDYNTEKDSDKKIKIVWKDILTNLMNICNIHSKPKIKSNLWKDTANNILAEAKCLSSIKWR